jgi:hypothetical protein
MIKFDYTNTKARLYPQDNCPLIKVIGALPTIVSDGLMGAKCWVAGGFIRRWFNNLKQDSDIDLFFTNIEFYNLVCEALNARTIEPVKVNQFNQMYKIKVDDKWTIPVQAICHQYYPNISELLDSFDFTICQFAYDGFTIHTTENAVLDCTRKRLVPHKIKYGVSSLRRIIKYSQQGYYMCGGAASSFLTQIVQNPDNIKGEVISVD